jgi:hypothetical protein
LGNFEDPPPTFKKFQFLTKEPATPGVSLVRIANWRKVGDGEMKKTESDSKGPAEFIFFALELLPDELFLASIVVGVVFTLVWLLREIFRIYLGE